MINRPSFPKRAVITSGMPYGNKELHFGHVGGLYIHADTFARFMRDRIGERNVIFQSGTDCYGSPSMEGYRKKLEDGSFTGTIEQYVELNHSKQIETFKDFDVKLDFFGASAVGVAKPVHAKVSAEIFELLYSTGMLKKVQTLQFFDEKLGVFLNGRQVIGKCPIDGCKSEKAYADECDLGHQFSPEELIDPISVLSGGVPVLRPISNWYFDVPAYNNDILKWVEERERESCNREFATKEIREFLKKPEIYIVKKNQMELWSSVSDSLPNYELVDDENKNSFTIIFDRLEDREKACEILKNNGIRYRTGKTLVPFRLTGNVEWGVPVPEKEGEKDLTFYVWPESLWSPISFTQTFLSMDNDKASQDWKDWWCNEETKIYQFLGEDNVYFYGPAEIAIFTALNGVKGSESGLTKLNLPTLIVNKHILYMGVKASSSSEIMKPPMAHELLKFYSPEQLRMHFLGMGLGNTNVSFRPKVYMSNPSENEPDIVLKESNMLTNVYNRVLRHLLNEIKTTFDNVIPDSEISEDKRMVTFDILYQYEKLMSECKLHIALNLVDKFVRDINKYWSAESRTQDVEAKAKVLITTLFMIRYANLMLHPMVPTGTEKVAHYFNWNDKCFDWKYIESDFETINDGNAKIPPIESQFDFFTKLDYQY